MKNQFQIQYRYSKITDEQFATFEENYDKSLDVDFQNTVAFSFNYEKNILTCSDAISFLQGEKSILKLELKSFFMIHPDSVNDLLQDDIFCCPKEILWQFASLNYGSMRGVLYERTKETALRHLILPPFFFDELIKDGVRFEKKD